MSYADFMIRIWYRDGAYSWAIDDRKTGKQVSNGFARTIAAAAKEAEYFMHEIIRERRVGGK